MSTIFAKNIMYAIKAEVEAGDPDALALMGFAQRAHSAMQTFDREAIAALHADMTAHPLEKRYFRELAEEVGMLHYIQNVVPQLPTSQDFDHEPNATLKLVRPTRVSMAEGNIMQQKGPPSVFARVFVNLEPVDSGRQVQLRWLAAEDEIPKEFLPPIFEALTETLRTPRPGDSRIVGVRVTVTGGRYSPTDSTAAAYAIAAKRACEAALDAAGLAPGS